MDKLKLPYAETQQHKQRVLCRPTVLQLSSFTGKLLFICEKRSICCYLDIFAC